MEAKPPSGVTDAKPVVAEQAKPKKKGRRQPVTSAPATVAVVAPAAPSDPAPSEAAKLGALGSGGDANPRHQQDVADRISAVEKRLTDMPAAVQDREQKQIAKVRLFTKEASDALKAGDVDGARILATKAELLLDDLTK
jgi:Spy/CpxP family protein refolding chaperone